MKQWTKQITWVTGYNPASLLAWSTLDLRAHDSNWPSHSHWNTWTGSKTPLVHQTLCGVVQCITFPCTQCHRAFAISQKASEIHCFFLLATLSAAKIINTQSIRVIFPICSELGMFSSIRDSFIIPVINVIIVGLAPFSIADETLSTPAALSSFRDLMTFLTSPSLVGQHTSSS